MLSLHTNTKILLVYGGSGNEAEISIKTKNGIRKALDELGFANVEEYNFDADAIAILQNKKPDIVFNAMHGKWGEDGCLPMLCDFLKIPYTHSGYTTSNIAINKELTKEIAKSIGIKICSSQVIAKSAVLNGNYDTSVKSFIKPYSQGSSRCAFIIKQNEKLSAEQLRQIEDNDEQFYIMEEFFDGVAIDVAVFRNKVLGAVEVVPKNEFYDFEAKYTKGMSDYFVPPRINSFVLQEILNATERLHNTIDAKYISRSDFIVSGDDYRFLEINTHPGMTETSLVPKIASYFDISYSQIVKELLNNASYTEYK